MPDFDLDRSPWAIGLFFGPWQVLRELKTGGMGTVYWVVNEAASGSRRFALKAIREDIAHDSLAPRFLGEREVLTRLDHPDIIKIVDQGETGKGVLYFVMDYVEGQPLTDYCFEEQLPLDDRLRLFLRVCRAVAYLHSQKVAHRDLKPGNIFVTSEGDPKLLDFGIAKSFAHPHKSTVAGLRPYTLAYASPEALCGATATFAGDVFSLGTILYRLLTGQGAFGDPEIMGQDRFRTAVLQADPIAPGEALADHRMPDDPSRLRPEFKRGLDAIVLKSLRKQPDRRYPSAAEFAADVALFLDGGKPSAAEAKENRS
jgi:serine/threonine-protein kinase